MSDEKLKQLILKELNILLKKIKLEQQQSIGTFDMNSNFSEMKKSIESRNLAKGKLLMLTDVINMIKNLKVMSENIKESYLKKLINEQLKIIKEGGSYKTAAISFNQNIRKTNITYSDIENWFEKNQYYQGVFDDFFDEFLEELKDLGYSFNVTNKELLLSPKAKDMQSKTLIENQRLRSLKRLINEQIKKTYKIEKKVNGKMTELIVGSIEDIRSTYSKIIDDAAERYPKLYSSSPNTIEKLLKVLNGASKIQLGESNKSITFELAD